MSSGSATASSPLSRPDPDREVPGVGETLRIPVHVGVTMDGNGRWAVARGRPRTEGHREGIRALRRLVEYAIRYGVRYLTVYSFSSENWRRPKSEIEFIFNLMKRFVESDLQKLHRNDVRIRILGERHALEPGLQGIINRVETVTRNNRGLNLNVAFNYGGRSEIVAAARQIAQRVASGELKAGDVDEKTFSESLFTAGIPDPDLLIRTGGEQRTSNFLVWQGAYAELVFQDVLWPDFDEGDFVAALQVYSGRQRRFGGVEAAQ